MKVCFFKNANVLKSYKNYLKVATGVLMARSMTCENNRKCYVSDLFLFEFGGQPIQIIIEKIQAYAAYMHFMFIVFRLEGIFITAQ